MINQLLGSPLLTTPIVVVTMLMRGCSPTIEAPDLSVPYPAPDGKARTVDIFLPGGDPPERGWPTVIFFHGGAWQRGDKRQFHGQCTELSRNGVACMSVEYRLGEQDGARVQDSLDDALAAVWWLRDHADTWRLDSSAFVLGGGSAGGHLAVMLATGQRDRPPVPCAALILFNPTLDLSPGMPDHEYVDDDWEALSPMHQLRGQLPPTLILVGTNDPEAPIWSMRKFCSRAEKLGAHCELKLARGQPHGFFNPAKSRWFYFKTLYQIHRFLVDYRIIQ